VRANTAPFANLSVDPTAGAAPLSVVLDASASSDPDGAVLSFEFDFDGDGAWDTSPQPSPTAGHVYGTAGFYSPKVLVTDSDGAYDMEGKVFMDAVTTKKIGQLPSREVLLSQLVGVLSAPISMFLYILTERGKMVEAK